MTKFQSLSRTTLTGQSITITIVIHWDPCTRTAMAPQPPPMLSSINNQHIESTAETFGLTAEEIKNLRRHAVAAKDTAYCPYSKFRVGAVLLTSVGAYVAGANVENAAYPVGTCAERVAFGKAITEGHRGFKAVAVATDISPPASPCGMCRQL